jgi:hypothetical protein
MLPANLNELVPKHIQELIDSEVTESLILEYKQQLPSDQADEKRTFLYNIAAMANTAGGDFVFGVVDRKGIDNQSTGIANSLSGMKLPNPQSEISRLENLIRDGIAPRLLGVAIQLVRCDNGDVLVIRVPRSWNKPHMVTFGGADRFFARAATGRYPMRVDEIGRAFSEQNELSQAIDNWRIHRVALVENKRGPVKLSGEVSLLFHVIPSSTFTRNPLRESWDVPQIEKLGIYVPRGGTRERYNADGFLRFGDSGDPSGAEGYTQIFRSGAIEYADSTLFFPPLANVPPMIFGQVIEQEIVNCFEDAINRLRRQSRSEPIYVGFSLIGIKDKSFYSTIGRLAFSRKTAIADDSFTSPEVFVDINETEMKPFRKTLLPLIDTLWQVAGLAGTPFRLKGEWCPFANIQ